MAGEITRLLAAWREGDPSAPSRLFPLVYEELRRMARGQLRRPRRVGSIDTTGLVHEAYIKLAGGSQVSLHDREHFFALAARAMRQILVDYARHHNALKRGGRRGADDDIRIEDIDLPGLDRATELLAIHEALARLEALDPRMGKIVEMRVFGGLSVEEIASVLRLSGRSVEREWNKARAFLYLELGGDGRP